MPSVDLRKARAFLEAKEKKENAANAKLFAKAKKDQTAILKMIAQKYRPLRIYVWGSLLHKKNFRQYSDIDIALEGITDAKSFFALVGEAMALTDFPVDIVQMEKIEPEFAELIRLKGKIVYERKK
jgi:predicted nucleotidyltransferase